MRLFKRIVVEFCSDEMRLRSLDPRSLATAPKYPEARVDVIKVRNTNVNTASAVFGNWKEGGALTSSVD